MAINMRQGNDADFDPTKLTAGEFAFLHNSKRIAAAFKDGTVKYMQTTEDAEEYLAQADEHLNEVKNIQVRLKLTLNRLKRIKYRPVSTEMIQHLKQIFRRRQHRQPHQMRTQQD